MPLKETLCCPHGPGTAGTPLPSLVSEAQTWCLPAFFEVTKPANRQTENNGVDAISGATITSQALGKTLDQWFGFYQNYLNKNAAACSEKTCEDCCCCEAAEEVEPVNTVEE